MLQEDLNVNAGVNLGTHDMAPVLTENGKTPHPCKVLVSLMSSGHVSLTTFLHSEAC